MKHATVGMAEKRAFIAGTPDIDGEGVFLAESAGKARYRCFLAARDSGFISSLTEIRVRRAPEFDGMLPKHSGWMPEYIRLRAGSEEP